MILQRGWPKKTFKLPSSLSLSPELISLITARIVVILKKGRAKNVDWSIAFLDLSILKRSSNDFFYIALKHSTPIDFMKNIFNELVKSINCFCKYTRDLWDSTDPIIPFPSIPLGFSKQVENIDDDQTQFGNKSDVKRIETSWKHRSNSFRALVPR